MQITRREFAASLAAPLAAPSKWNLMLITNDQHRADCLGALGNRVIRTPNLDRLAGQGALFEQYYVQCPQCVPSRTALHTGRYPHVNRTPTNLYRLPDGEETLATMLGRQGWTTAALGEMPFAPTRFTGGFGRIYASGPELGAFRRERGWKGGATPPAPFQAAPAPWPEELDETPFFAGKAVAFLREHRDRPFYLHVNFRRPHHPFDPPKPYDRMYDGAVFPPSHKRAGEMDNKPPAQRKYLENSVGFDLRTMTARDLDRIKSYYYGMISENDKYIGQILAELDRLQLSDRTVVVFVSDHGEMLGDHGLLFKGGYFYDEVVRVPLIVRAPGRIPAGKRVRQIVQEIDVTPTLLELLGLPVPARVQGRSLLEERKNGVVYAEFPGTKMIRTADWKLVHYLRAPYGELYNLREDPHELYNRYDDPASLKARAEMQARLTDWLVDSQDPLLKPVEAGK